MKILQVRSTAAIGTEGRRPCWRNHLHQLRSPETTVCFSCDVQNQEIDKSEILTHRLGIHQSQLSGSNAKQVAGKKCTVFPPFWLCAYWIYIFATFCKFQYVEMPIVSRPDCQEDYSGVNGVDEGMICAGIDEGGGIMFIIVSSVRSSYSHPDLLLIHHPLFQITPVLNTGLSLSEPLQLYKGYNAI